MPRNPHPRSHWKMPHQYTPEASMSLGSNREIILDGKDDVSIQVGTDLYIQDDGYISGSGTYLSGSGEFLIGDSVGGRLSYDDGTFFVSSSELILKLVISR